MRYDKDQFGERMKALEAVATERRFDPTRPLYVRLDGRNFSKFTADMCRPFDGYMTAAMQDTAAYLVKETRASCAYVQSDEISLAWAPPKPGSEFMFAGREQKLVSVLAGMASAYFSALWPGVMASRNPHFDCSIFSLDPADLVNTFLWRQLDCYRNAASMAVMPHFSPVEVHGVGTQDKIEMLERKKIYFAGYPLSFRHGTFVHNRMVQVPVSDERMQEIPEKYRPTEPVMRSQIDFSHHWLANVADRRAFILGEQWQDGLSSGETTPEPSSA